MRRATFYLSGLGLLAFACGALILISYAVHGRVVFILAAIPVGIVYYWADRKRRRHFTNPSQ